MPEILKEVTTEPTVFDKMNKSFKRLINEVKCKHGYIFQKSKLRKLEYPKEILISFNEMYVIGKGGFGTVYHAYWPLKKKCIAFKSTCKFGGKREIQVLNYFKNLGKLNPNESKYIAEMYGYVELKEKIVIALELGQNNLRGYYLKNILKSNNRYLFSTKLLKGAAKALEQFHKRNYFIT
uniref:Protein kinase domain-containing protein n=1 Tax=Meloidogyne enterolobii TaxID=390850 RepID=A0A6V7UGN0_MELEN|nr:unnamed protein product [Meloidogyne enterolobii]